MNIFDSIALAFQQWGQQLYATFIEEDRYMMLVDGLKSTLIITVGALIIGVVLGAIIAIIRYCGEDIPFMKPLCKLCDLYTTVIRGIPVVVVLLIFYFVILKRSDGIVVGIVTFGINSSAYMAELMRSGIQAVDPGQMEAGRSLGMSQLQTTWKIILPQAMKNILPAIGNEMIALLKETSVAGYVAVADLTKGGDIIRSRTYSPFLPLLAVALIYLILVMFFSYLVSLLERRLRNSDH